MQTPGKAKAVVLFVHGHGAYLMHELLHIPVRSLISCLTLMSLLQCKT